ncbi:MAG: CoA transferase [Nocardioidaceae bacterium]
MPAGKVRTIDDVYTWEQTRSQGLVVEVDHPVLGTVELPGPPIRFDDLKYAGGRAEHLPPPWSRPAQCQRRRLAGRARGQASGPRRACVTPCVCTKIRA